MRYSLFVYLFLLFDCLIAQELEVEGKKMADTIDLSGGNVINLANPINEQDAVTKAYVDSLNELVTDLNRKLTTLEQCGSTFIEDVDSNTYDIVAIGDQCWIS